MRISLLIFFLVVLTGCVAVWGKSYNVAISNSRSVAIEYDRVVANVTAMLQAVQSKCEKYKKDAVLDNVSTANLSILVNTNRCETRKADNVIDVQG